MLKFSTYFTILICFLNGLTPGLFFHYFQFHFKYNFYNKQCEKSPSTIRCWDLNSQPSYWESRPITTRPALPPFLICHFMKEYYLAFSHGIIQNNYLLPIRQYSDLLKNLLATVTRDQKPGIKTVTHVGLKLMRDHSKICLIINFISTPHRFENPSVVDTISSYKFVNCIKSAHIQMKKRENWIIFYYFKTYLST